jgi:hypothetical protein
MRRGPSLPGFLFGVSWIVVALVLFATMVSGYAYLFGVTGTLFAISVLPLGPRLPVHCLVSRRRLPLGLGRRPGHGRRHGENSPCRVNEGPKDNEWLAD